MDFRRIIQEYSEQLYTQKYDNLDEMDQFLERYNLSEFTNGEIDNLNKTVSIKEIESIINNFLKEKATGPHGFIDELYQTFKEEIIIYTFFQRIVAEEMLPNSFYEANINLMPKQRHYKI